MRAVQYPNAAFLSANGKDPKKVLLALCSRRRKNFSVTMGGDNRFYITGGETKPANPQKTDEWELSPSVEIYDMKKD